VVHLSSNNRAHHVEARQHHCGDNATDRTKRGGVNALNLVGL
jgi:hypothetical protein